MFDRICGQAYPCSKEVLEATIELAVEIAREGREGRRIGTLFTVGEERAVLEQVSAAHPRFARRPPGRA